MSEPKKKTSPVVIILVALGALLVVGPCCIGMVSAIAIPQFVGYIRRAKTTEATMNLRSIAQSEMQFCEAHGNWLVPAGPMPAAPGPAIKQMADFSADPGFAQLGFSVGDPIYYSYAVEHDPSVTGGVLLVAHGDLDGDSFQSTFSIACGSACHCAETPVINQEFE